MFLLPRPRRAPAHPSAALLALAAAALSTPVWAQTPPDAGRLLEQTRQPAVPVLPPATAPRVVDVPVRPTITLPEGVTVQASAFRVTGATSYPVDTLTAMLQPWVGKRLDIAGLNEAAGALTRHYQSRGHLLTYAYLPAQRVADGVIEIAVLEGKLDAVQIVTAQDVRLRDEVIQAHTDRLATSAEQPRPVLLPEVERQMLLLNDIPGVAARAAFTPGSSTGGADMVVSVAEDEPLALRLELDNHGSRSTGETRAGAGLQLRDLFGWGDQTDLRALVSSRAGLVSGSLGVLVPVGGDGFRIGASVSRLSYELAGAFRNLGASGNANTLGTEVSYPFIRSADTKGRGAAHRPQLSQAQQDHRRRRGLRPPRRLGRCVGSTGDGIHGLAQPAGRRTARARRRRSAHPAHLPQAGRAVRASATAGRALQPGAAGSRPGQRRQPRQLRKIQPLRPRRGAQLRPR